MFHCWERLLSGFSFPPSLCFTFHIEPEGVLSWEKGPCKCLTFTNSSRRAGLEYEQKMILLGSEWKTSYIFLSFSPSPINSGYFGVIFILSIIKTSTFQDNIDGASFSIFLKVLPELSCVGSEMKIANLMNIYDIGPRDHLWESLRDLHRGGLFPLQTRSSYPWVVQQFPGLENLLHFRF